MWRLHCLRYKKGCGYFPEDFREIGAYFSEVFQEIGAYFPEVFWEIGAYFPEVFRDIGAYFPEVVKMAMLQKSHMRQPSQGWCGRHTGRTLVNSFVQGLGTACTVEMYLLILYQ